LAGFLHCNSALETCWQRFGQILNDFLYEKLNFLYEILVFSTKILDFLYEKS